MYLSLATATVHTTHEWQPRSERGGASALARGSHLNS